MSNDNELFDFMLDNWALSCLGELDKDKDAKLRKLDKDWKGHMTSQIASCLVAHIIQTTYAGKIEQGLPADWDEIVETVRNKLKEYTQFGPFDLSQVSELSAH